MRCNLFTIQGLNVVSFGVDPAVFLYCHYQHVVHSVSMNFLFHQNGIKTTPVTDYYQFWAISFEFSLNHRFAECAIV